MNNIVNTNTEHAEDKPINTPQNIKDFEGQFVVFFPEESNPKVLFNSYNPSQAYETADGIFKLGGKRPAVVRVVKPDHNFAQHLLMR